MAAPVNRRFGSSRKAQYSTFFGYAAGVLGAILGAVLVIVSLVNPDAFSGLRSWAADAASPAAGVTAEARSAGGNAVSIVSGFLQTGSRNAKMQRELAEAKVRLVEADAVREENRRLKRLLGLSEENAGTVTAARMTGSTSAGTRRIATLDSGRDKGIAPGMPVRAPLGLVGRILDVGATSAHVLLITDGESLVPVRRARDGVPAFAQGNGDGTLRIRLINLGINPLKKGDMLVTSGSGGLYRPDTPIAMVDRVLRDGAIARVLSNPGDADYVLVERAWAQVAPAPTAAPSTAPPTEAAAR
ncbi:rod shape-determining protein MreC [Novosphingobium colocasiae]|uniref:Cell shape-determining protein MreC n=1 Tax=Novosphingobium colocasiae TaxID=1256513 RepID=A0A918UDR7_9SPHN|nr:rod shape-determining protein MreC [Novosphingobium colocasiae]GGY97707.1 hypothetical protein GCM10011614_10980 [Novosphingobium colocasiae]